MGCVSLFSGPLPFWFTFLPWLCPSGSQWQSPGNPALRPQPAGCALHLWGPWPSRLSRGAAQSSLCSQHLFWKSTDDPGLLLPRNSSLPCQFSEASHLLVFHPDFFLAVLSKPSSYPWKWQIPSLFLLSCPLTFLPC